MDFADEQETNRSILNLISPDERFMISVSYTPDTDGLCYHKFTVIESYTGLNVITNPTALEFYDFVVNLLESETLL